MKYLPFPASADVYSWKRRDNLPKGFRLYTSAERVRQIKGVVWNADTKDSKGLPETANRFLCDGQFFALDLESEAPTQGRYMNMRERFERFCDVILAFRNRDHWPVQFRNHGAPIFVAGHGPTADWRDRTESIWSKLPQNDSDIFDRPAVTEDPKHGPLAERLAPLLQWRRMGKPIQPVSTNWMEADNDNHSEDHADARPAADAERRYRAGPEPETLVKMAGPFEMTFRHARLKDCGEADCLPLFPDRMGRLKFSNGRVEERGERLPHGAIRYYDDEFTELLGSEPDPAEDERRRSYWTGLFGKTRAYGSDDFIEREMERVDFIKAGRIRRKVKMTQAEQLEILANQPHPPVTYCKPGLPCGHDDIGSQFVGGWISNTKGVRTMDRWEDVSDEMSRQDEFERWRRELPPEQQKALNLVVIAANFKDIGVAFGKRGKTAEREGKRRVLAANDNLQKIMAA